MENQELLNRLSALLARGATIRQAAASLARPKTTLHRLAQRHHLPRRRLGLPAATERRLKTTITALARRGVHSVRKIAREAGVSERAVARRLIERFRKLVGDNRYRKCTPWRCRCGLLLEIRECVACGQVKPARVPRRKRQ